LKKKLKEKKSDKEKRKYELFENSVHISLLSSNRGLVEGKLPNSLGGWLDLRISFLRMLILIRIKELVV
jgi:hypothetical protein